MGAAKSIEGGEAGAFDHVWYWRKKLPERKGAECRVLARGAMNSVLVEFRDGHRTVTSRYAVRRKGGPRGQEGA